MAHVEPSDDPVFFSVKNTACLSPYVQPRFLITQHLQESLYGSIVYSKEFRMARRACLIVSAYAEGRKT